MLEDQALQAAVQQLVGYFTQVDKSTLREVRLGVKSKDALQRAAEQYLRSETSYRDTDTVNRIITAFNQDVFGYGILEPLINDDTISDIKIIGPDRVRIKRLGQRENAEITFPSAEAINRFAASVAVKNQVSLSDSNAIQSFTDKSSNDRAILRINIATPYVNSVDNAYIHIRKIPKHKLGVPELVEAGMLTENMAQELVQAAKTAKGMLFCGQGGSGKTSLMNALLEEIPHNKSGLVIQENEELFSDAHPDLMFQHIVANRGEGQISYSLRSLARNGLLTDLNYFIIGEIKGDEAVDMLTASFSGHQCWASVHADTSEEAVPKLVQYITNPSASSYSIVEATRMLKSMEVIVFLQNFKVKEVSRVIGFDEKTERLIYKTQKREGGKFIDVE